MKPLLRYTIGPVNKIGFDILRHSIRLINKIYPDRFDIYICHNKLAIKQFDLVSKIAREYNIKLYEQSHTAGIEYIPTDVAWKLYPPRLDINRHEIFIDNDLIVFKKLEELDWFLDSRDAFFITGDINRVLGRRDLLIPANMMINSGLFGIPPFFDFAAAIAEVCQSDKERYWKDRFDEQGTIAAIFVRQQKYKIIPVEKISICVDKYIPATHGMHFCLANVGNSDFWEQYRRSKVLC